MSGLEGYREELEGVDLKVMDLLRVRMEIVTKIQVWKRERGYGVYDYGRERELLRGLRRYQEGLGLEWEGLERIYGEIISYSRSLGGKLRVGYIGLEGLKASLEHFGRFIEDLRYEGVMDLFEGLRLGDIDYGLVYIWGSGGGLDEGRLNEEGVQILYESDLKVYGEKYIREGDIWKRFFIIHEGEGEGEGMGLSLMGYGFEVLDRVIKLLEGKGVNYRGFEGGGYYILDLRGVWSEEEGGGLERELGGLELELGVLGGGVKVLRLYFEDNFEGRM